MTCANMKVALLIDYDYEKEYLCIWMFFSERKKFKSFSLIHFYAWTVRFHIQYVFLHFSIVHEAYGSSNEKISNFHSMEIDDWNEIQNEETRCDPSFQQLMDQCKVALSKYPSECLDSNNMPCSRFIAQIVRQQNRSAYV